MISDVVRQGRPWYTQLNYLSICALMLLSPFMFLPGQKPILCMGVIISALILQANDRLQSIRVKKPAELVFYTLWGCWAIGTGIFIAKNRFTFTDGVLQLLRMMSVLWALFLIFYRQRNTVYIYFALIGVAIIQVTATQMGYQLDTSDLSLVHDVVDFDHMRASGLTGNANAMGFAMLAGIWACIMLWKHPDIHFRGRTLLRGGLIAGIIIFSYYLINTASRKSLLVEAILIGGWFMWLIPGRLSVRAVVFSALMVIVFGCSFVVLREYIMEDTTMGLRFQQWLDSGGGSATEGFKNNIRYWMYVDGFNFFLKHPIAGIGLSQFGTYHWSGMYSHSDYMEPLACTGLVGFLLYHGFAFTVLMRLIKLMVIRLPDEIAYSIKGMILFMIGNHFCIGFGAPLWNMTDHNLIVMFIGVYSWKIYNMVVGRQYIYLT